MTQDKYNGKGGTIMKLIVVSVLCLVVGFGVAKLVMTDDADVQPPKAPAYQYDARSVQFGFQFYQSIDAAFRGAKTAPEREAIQRGFLRFMDSVRVTAIADSIKAEMGK
jgi:hypothetical protein